MRAASVKPVPAPTPLVLPLEAAATAAVAEIGGKAAGLAALLAAGLPVPEGVVVTADACRGLLAAAGVDGAPAELARRVAAPAAPDEEAWLAAMRGRIEVAEVPAPLASALRDALAVLGDVPLAVRSSGIAEDLAHASFAGQYESFLGVTGEAAVADALGACVASLFGARVAAYLRGRAGPVPALGIAVVVQRLARADAAGVLFTVNPLTGREEEAVIEAVPGLADALVSGRANADTLVVDAAAGAVRERRMAGAAAVLADAEALALAELGARAQEALGHPLDVEWVREGGRLALVQARPVTRLHFAPDVGEWTTADFRDGGVSSGVCSPFMWSLYERAFDVSMPAYLRSLGLLPRGHAAKWTRMFFARPYWNVAEAKAAVLPLPGFVERNFDLDLGIEPAYEGPGRTTRTSVGSVLRALPVLARLLRGYRRRLAANAAFLRTFPDRAAPFELAGGALAALDAGAFRARYEAVLALQHETETAYFETIYNTSNAKLDLSVPLSRARARAGGALDYGRLVGGLADLSHLRPMKDLHDTLGRIRAEGRAITDGDVAAFAGRWPHRGRKELDLRVPRWPDDLPFVRETMERALAAWRPEDDPVAASRAQHDAYLAERARALGALRGRPLDRAGLRRRLARLRRFTWWREEMRDRSSYAYALVRRFAVEAGRRLVAAGALAAPDDVFLLRSEEVGAALAGALPPDEVRRRARAGERLVRSYRAFRPPNEIGARRAFDEDAPPPASGPTLHGTPCSPGRARGTARVVASVEEAQRLLPGDVLVAPFTDPGWTPLFPRLAAVVTETGGLLSHAAVIAREYGIPAVLAVPGATRLVQDGAPVVVDGGRGTVELAPGEEEA